MPFFVIETPTRSTSGQRDTDNKITRGLSRKFTLDASDASLDQFDARAALLQEFGVTEGVTYPGSSLFVCNSVRLSQTGPISYEAEATYETLSFDAESGDNGDPEAESPTIEYSSIQQEVETDVDADGNPIATDTGELYQGITRTVSDAVIVITKKYSSFSPAAFYAYENKVNDAEFLGFPAGTLLVKKISPKNIIENDRNYWEVSVEMHARRPLAKGVDNEKAWWLRVRHEGYECFVERNDGSFRKVRAVDANNQPVSQPVPLDKYGLRLINPDTGLIDDSQPPEFRFFEHYPPINFSLMNLGVQ